MVRLPVASPLLPDCERNQLDLGDDGLGYDFRVGSGRQPLLFEVKASQGEGGQIELGESEVRAAQRHTGSDRWRILMVTSVLEPSRLRVAMLPSPFSPRSLPRGGWRAALLVSPVSQELCQPLHPTCPWWHQC
ncbi:protein NO VEIN domain-containing protein [Streptomyces canus]|uniref:protein NO VEIN domain-containing protein n=1 Tax=Streptomyces TaxID=1883 RepID=UPI0036F169E9